MASGTTVALNGTTAFAFATAICAAILKNSESEMILYEHWLAADQFIQAGHPRGDVLALLNVSETQWSEFFKLFEWLHISNGWLRENRAIPEAKALIGHEPTANVETDRELFLKIVGRQWQHLGEGAEFSMTRAINAIRTSIFSNPRIGPFQGVDWIAVYIGQHYRACALRFVHDGISVHCGAYPLWGKDRQALADIAAESFRLVGERWMVDAHSAYAMAQTDGGWEYFYRVKGADPTSFVEVNLRYAKDAHAAYYITGKTMRINKPPAFVIVPDYHHTIFSKGQLVEDVYHSAIAKDDEHVYWAGGVLKLADPASFRHMPESKYYVDNMHVWFQYKQVIGADPQTLMVRGSFDACDRNRAYCFGEVRTSVESYDSWTKVFEKHGELSGWWWHAERQRCAEEALFTGEAQYVGGNYWQRNGSIYYRTAALGIFMAEDDLLEGARTQDFEVLSPHHARDQTHVYFKQHALAGLDARRFRLLDNAWVVDGTIGWYAPFLGRFARDEQKFKTDASSFESIDEWYARDRFGLICQGTHKKNIPNHEKAEGLGGGCLRIDQQIYFLGKAVKPSRFEAASARLIGKILFDAQGSWIHNNQFRKAFCKPDELRCLMLNDEESDFYADNKKVYYWNHYGIVVIDGAEPDRFKPTTIDTGTDGRINFEAPRYG